MTLSTTGVFGGITFSHTPEEAMSDGLAKACVPTKISPVQEKLSFLISIHILRIQLSSQHFGQRGQLFQYSTPTDLRKSGVSFGSG